MKIPLDDNQLQSLRHETNKYNNELNIDSVELYVIIPSFPYYGKYKKEMQLFYKTESNRRDSLQLMLVDETI